jgi:hypothetical protein
MPNYKVLVDVMEHNVADAGTYPDGRPKKVIEHYKGDSVDLSDVGEQRIQELIDSGAVEEDKGEDTPSEPEPEPAPEPDPTAKSTKSS